MDRLHDPAFQRRKAAVQLLQLFTAEARRFAVHMSQALPPPPSPGLAVCRHRDWPSVATVLTWNRTRSCRCSGGRPLQARHDCGFTSAGL